MVLPSFLSPVHRKLAEKLLGIGTLTKFIARQHLVRIYAAGLTLQLRYSTRFALVFLLLKAY